MIGLNDIRRRIVESPTAIRDILLTKQEHQVFRWVRHHANCLSSEIAYEFGLSAQHACMVMDKLYRKGYVDRSQVPQESGGYEYEYLSQID